MEKGNACTLEIRKDAELGKRVIEMERTIGKYEKLENNIVTQEMKVKAKTGNMT